MIRTNLYRYADQLSPAILRHAFRMPQARLIVAAGLPGSVKTTLARHLEQAHSAVRLSADDWMESLGISLHAEQERDRIEKLQWQLAQRLLSLGHIVIVEWGSWGRWERDILRLRARELGAVVELRFLNAPLEELFGRIQLRGMEDPPIQRADVQRWEEVMQIPDAEEFALFDPPLLDSTRKTADAPLVRERLHRT